MFRAIVRISSAVALGVLAVVVGLASIGLFASAASGTPADRVPMLVGGAVLGVLCIGLFYASGRIARERSPKSSVDADGKVRMSIDVPDDDPTYAAVRSIVEKHVHTLALEKRSRLVPDKYGVLDFEPWDREVDMFIERVAMPHVRATVSPKQYERSARRLMKRVRRRTPNADPNEVVRAVARAVIEREVVAHEAEFNSRAVTASCQSPDEFEEWCASELRALGWDARVTGQAGDQGVDVRAVRAGVVLVVQCKLYSQPAGNAAVQEVYAGKSFYRAQLAAVVSSSGFTKSARAIAQQTGVVLLTPSEIRDRFR